MHKIESQKITMMKRNLPCTYYLLVCYLLLFSTYLQAQQKLTLEEAVDIIVEPYTKDEKTQGLIIGVIEDGYFYKYAYGQLSATDTLPPTPKTSFHIGAMTKVLTTSLLMTLAQADRVKLDDAITKYLPDSIVQANPDLKKIHLEHLATHTAGFPKMPPNIALTSTDTENPYSNYQIKDLYAFLMDYQLPVVQEVKAKKQKKGKKKRKKKKRKKRGETSSVVKPLQAFKYSHIGMALLGHLLENALQDDYQNILQKYILRHLSIHQTKLALSDESKEAIAQGHKLNGEVATPLTYGALPAAEGLHSTLNDLLLFAQANMEPAVNKELYAILSKCHQPQIQTDMRWVQVAYGWYTMSLGKGEPHILTHSGRTGGFSNFVGMVKETKTAVVVLSNSAIRVDGMGLQILELLNQ